MKKQYILTVGRVEVGKGSLLLVDAFLSIYHEFPHVSLMFIGEDTDMLIEGKRISCIAYLQKKILNHNAQNRIIFHKPMMHNSLGRFYRNCLFYVAPSYGHENMSLAILEAITAGRAIIGSNTGGTPEIIEHNKMGLLFISQNKDDLSEKIRLLLNDDHLRKYYEKNAIRASQAYNIHTIAEQTLTFYTNVAHSSCTQHNI